MNKKEILAFLKKVKKSHLTQLLEPNNYSDKTIEVAAMKIGNIRILVFMEIHDEYSFVEVYQGTKRIANVDMQQDIDSCRGLPRHEFYVEEEGEK